MQHRRLIPDDTGWPSTMSGVVALLRQQAGFDSRHSAKIELGPLQLPWLDVAWLIDVVFQVDAHICAHVSLPASITFRAVISGESRCQIFCSKLLDNASLNFTGCIALPNGRKLEAVDVVPAIARLNPSTLDRVIIHCLIEFNHAQSYCYENPIEHVPAALRNLEWNDLRTINYGRLQQLRIPLLKVLVHHFIKRFPGRRPPSEQKVADTLRACGLRVPAPRPRKTILA